MAREEGREQGFRKGLIDAIGVIVNTRFGPAGRTLLTKARRIQDLSELRRLAEVVANAQTVDEVRRRLR